MRRKASSSSWPSLPRAKVCPTVKIQRFKNSKIQRFKIQKSLLTARQGLPDCEEDQRSKGASKNIREEKGYRYIGILGILGIYWVYIGYIGYISGILGLKRTILGVIEVLLVFAPEP